MYGRICAPTISFTEQNLGSVEGDTLTGHEILCIRGCIFISFKSATIIGKKARPF